MVFAWRKGKLRLAPETPEPKAVTAPKRSLHDKDYLDPRVEVSPHLRSIDKYDDENTARALIEAARMEKIAASSQAFLTDDTGQLRIRYDDRPR